MNNALTEIEQHLAWEASKQGLLMFEQTGEAGWPRWLVIGASNAHGFISLVPPGEKATPLQLQRLDSLVRIGHLATCADSKKGVEDFITEFAFTRVSQWHAAEAGQPTWERSAFAGGPPEQRCGVPTGRSA